MAAFEGGYPSENDNIPSQRGVSEHTAEEPTSSAQPETVPGNIAIMKEQMKSENLHKKSKTSDKMSIFEPERSCVRKTLKITSIAPDKLREICNLLNIIRSLGGDWRSLAGELGYTALHVKTFELTRDSNGPTGDLLLQWDGIEGHFADEILKILKGMERADVYTVLEAEIKKKCQGCNCENCRSTR